MSPCLPWQMHCDDTNAGRLAMAAIFPQVVFKRCLPHQLQAVRRRTGELKKFVAIMVSLTGHTVNLFLFAPLAVRAPEARVCGCGRGGVRVRTCQRRGPKTGPPDKTSSKTSSRVSIAGFPGTVPGTMPGWFLFLLSPVPVTTFRNGFRYSQTRLLLLPAP